MVYQLTIIDNDGLLRLGRTALAIISHMSREPFIHAFSVGCVAEAIMDYPDKFDLFAWVIRSSRQSLRWQIMREVERLLGCDNIVTNQAAYRLLSFEGSTKAFDTQQQLPDNLFDNQLRKLFGDNPCNYQSPWPLNRCDDCISTADGKPRLLAMNLRRCSLNPDFRVSEEIAHAFTTIVEALPTENMWQALINTSEDHTLDFVEPALCAYTPHIIAGLIRSLARTASERIGMPLRQLAYHLGEHYLVLNGKEYDVISDAWKNLLKDDLSQSPQRLTENLLFGLILHDLTGDEQLPSSFTTPKLT